MKTFLSITAAAAVITGCETIPTYPSTDGEKPASYARYHLGGDVFGAYEPYLAAHRESPQALSKLGYKYDVYKKGIQPETHLRNNALLRERANEILDSVAAGVAAQRPDPKTGKISVMLYFHGGLGKPQDGLGRVERFLKNWGGRPAHTIYPIFVSWRSGPGVSLRDRYFHVRDGEYVGSPGSPLRFPFHIISDLGSGIANAPESLYDVLADSSENRDVKKIYSEESKTRYARFARSGVLSIPGDPRPGFLNEAKEYLPRYTTGLARSVTTPAIQGFGAPAWNAMRRRAEKMFVTEADSHGYRDGYRTEAEFQRGDATGIASLLARRLAKLDRSLGGNRLEITLVGHSMGAILANQLVRDYPNLPIKRILHMGSADNVRNWKSMTAPWLKRHPEAEFFNLVLHPFNEAREDYSWPLKTKMVPRGGLLVWVDQLMTTHASTDDYTSGTWKTARKLLYEYEKLGNAHLKVFPIDGNISRVPTTHSGFSKTHFLDRSVYWR